MVARTSRRTICSPRCVPRAIAATTRGGEGDPHTHGEGGVESLQYGPASEPSGSMRTASATTESQRTCQAQRILAGETRKSPRLRVLQGTFRPDRAGHETPDSPQGVPTSPKRLTGDASAEWKRMIGRLEKSGTLAVVDDAVLYQYVRLFAETEASVTRQAKNEARAARLEQEIEKTRPGGRRVRGRGACDCRHHESDLEGRGPHSAVTAGHPAVPGGVGADAVRAHPGEGGDGRGERPGAEEKGEVLWPW